MNERLPDLPARIETDRLIIRPYQESDAAAYYEVCQRNKAHLAVYEADNPLHEVETVVQAQALVRDFAEGWRKRSVFFFGVWEKSSGAFAAQIYLGVVNSTLPEFELGYFADCAREGQGYVREAAQAVLGFAFEHLQAQRVRLSCNETNVRSWRLAERLGFVREGYLRESNNRFLLPDGAYSGDMIYGLLKREFCAQTSHKE